MTNAAHAALEIKSDPEHANDDHAEVTAALGEFKTAVDDRLAALETKSADDKKTADRLKAIETRLARTGTGALEVKSADNDNGAFEAKAFLSYVRKGVERMPQDEAKALTVAVGATAGYLAPSSFSNEILKKIVLYSPIRVYAKTMQISGPQIIFPRRVSTLTAQWVSEIGQRPESGPTFEQVTLTPFEMATFVPLSNQLLEDNAYDLEGELAIEFGEDFARLEGAAFINGTGVGQPMGIMTSPQITNVITTASTGQIGLLDIIAAYHALPSAYAQNGSWIMNRATLGNLRRVVDGTGRPLLFDSITTGAPTTLLGRPVVEMVDMPAQATGATPIVFADLSGYRIVDRVGLETLRDPFTLATVGQTRLHARKRVGGDVTNPDRFVKIAVK